ncbi:PAS domain-containing protein [Xanthobacter sp. V4C-4]|uniref:PAS domain-containing protein n=1 Tax=Xanthobacter cornucopiae TaxID=3119924 RepID=UPI003726A060
MMTETKARALDLSDPRLAPLRQEDLPSFLVDVSSSAILAATAAGARLGMGPERAPPPQVAEAARALGGGRPAALVRLRLPRSLTPRLFRAQLLDIDGAPMALFADPAAFRDDPALAVEARQPAPGPAVTLEALDPALRFTFETDADDRLRSFSAALASALGAGADAWLGATFPELEAAGRIVSGHAAADALARGAAFSGVHVTVPGPVVIELELGGVPLFDASRRRLATRGFGVLRRWRAGPDGPAPAAPVAAEAGSWPPPPAAPHPPAPRQTPSNVVAFSGLTPRESTYFDEIGRTLEAAMRADARPPAQTPPAPTPPPPPEPAETAASSGAILDTLPLATLLEDADQLVHANRAFLEWTGWPDVDAVRAVGGVPHVLTTGDDGDGTLLTADGDHLPVEARMVDAPFHAPDARLHVLRRREAASAQVESAVDPRRAALDLVPWPVLLIGDAHRILFANHAASERLGFPATELEGQPITTVLAPEGRGEAVGWLDRARARPGGRRPRVLLLRPNGGGAFHALAGLAPVGEDTGQMCLVLGPEPRAETRSDAKPGEAASPAGGAAPVEGAGAPQAPRAETERAAPGAPLDTTLPEAALHMVARRLSESLGPSFSTLAAYAPDDAVALPPAVHAALATVQKCIDDLGALAAPLAEGEREPTAPAPLVSAAVAFALARARRRHVSVRTDIDDVPRIATRPARLARLVRLILEDALDAAPPHTAIIVSLLCDDHDGGAPVVLQVSDAGPPVDEVDEAAARAPLAPSPGTDRFSRAGRPLRMARLVDEAHALGATFALRRGIAKGMTAQLTLPR